MMLFYFQRLIEIYPFFLKGLWMTVAVSGISLVMATIFGLLLGIVRASENKLLFGSLSAPMWPSSGEPPLWFRFHHFFHSAGMGHSARRISGGNPRIDHPGTAFICEIVAGGIKAVPRGQWEAASSSGLNLYQQLRYVIIPQSLQTILPPLVGQYVLLIKDSSVVSVIGVVD
jgi:polar amino acid transport system permease protein